jgi:hypothetical protein
MDPVGASWNLERLAREHPGLAGFCKVADHRANGLASRRGAVVGRIERHRRRLEPHNTRAGGGDAQQQRFERTLLLRRVRQEHVVRPKRDQNNGRRRRRRCGRQKRLEPRLRGPLGNLGSDSTISAQRRASELAHGRREPDG